MTPGTYEIRSNGYNGGKILNYPPVTLGYLKVEGSPDFHSKAVKIPRSPGKPPSWLNSHVSVLVDVLESSYIVYIPFLRGDTHPMHQKPENCGLPQHYYVGETEWSGAHFLLERPYLAPTDPGEY